MILDIVKEIAVAYAKEGPALRCFLGDERDKEKIKWCSYGKKRRMKFNVLSILKAAPLKGKPLSLLKTEMA